MEHTISGSRALPLTFVNRDLAAATTALQP
jgi:hypothetical protein